MSELCVVSVPSPPVIHPTAHFNKVWFTPLPGNTFRFSVTFILPNSLVVLSPFLTWLPLIHITADHFLFETLFLVFVAVCCGPLGFRCWDRRRSVRGLLGGRTCLWYERKEGRLDRSGLQTKTWWPWKERGEEAGLGRQNPDSDAVLSKSRQPYWELWSSWDETRIKQTWSGHNYPRCMFSEQLEPPGKSSFGSKAEQSPTLLPAAGCQIAALLKTEWQLVSWSEILAAHLHDLPQWHCTFPYSLYLLNYFFSIFFASFSFAQPLKVGICQGLILDTPLICNLFLNLMALHPPLWPTPSFTFVVLLSPLNFRLLNLKASWMTPFWLFSRYLTLYDQDRTLASLPQTCTSSISPHFSK